MTVLLIIFVLTDTDNERYPRQKKHVDVTLLEAVFQLLQGKCKYERSQQGANNAGLNLQKLATKWPNRKKLAVSRRKKNRLCQSHFGFHLGFAKDHEQTRDLDFHSDFAKAFFKSDLIVAFLMF